MGAERSRCLQPSSMTAQYKKESMQSAAAMSAAATFLMLHVLCSAYQGRSARQQAYGRRCHVNDDSSRPWTAQRGNVSCLQT
mmetsp:Transcript_73268/g.141727  ORF Transcript_73268/g.141727 Transcript_73268/m.141727 type:complete len:82 (-) Transcript_73268:171-416(-)